jgi:ADP-ribosyl-[dinitrogen reductase] hydrolase
MTTREDRIAGVLLGQAAGDALGTHYETGIPSHGHAEMLGGGYGFEPGEYSDDTQQAVCVAQARSEPLAVAERLLKWYRSHPKDIGAATRAVLSGCRAPGDVLAASKAYGEQMAARLKPRGWHPGLANGSLMRTGPVCLPFLGDRDRVAAVAREVSDVTHYDPYAGDACVLWSLAIEAAISAGHGANAQSLISAGLPYVPQGRRGWWSEVIAQALRSRPAVYRMNGSAVGAFAAALSSVSHARSLPNGLQKAIQIGGDTDTVAAIAGALLGAVHGASSVPSKWREAVHGWPGLKAEDLERLALEASGAL